MRGGQLMGQKTPGIGKEHVAQGADARWITMRYDPSHRNLSYEMRQQLKLGRALRPIQ
jgi:hypothetical protein